MSCHARLISFITSELILYCMRDYVWTRWTLLYLCIMEHMKACFGGDRSCHRKLWAEIVPCAYCEVNVSYSVVIQARKNVDDVC